MIEKRGLIMYFRQQQERKVYFQRLKVAQKEKGKNKVGQCKQEQASDKQIIKNKSKKCIKNYKLNKFEQFQNTFIISNKTLLYHPFQILNLLNSQHPNYKKSTSNQQANSFQHSLPISHPMIQLYAILHNFDTVLQLQIPNKSNRDTLCALYKHIQKKIKGQQSVSKLIQSMKIQSYLIYYFRQDQFVFIIVTTNDKKTDRVHNYLRVIAEIFYQNYDEKKFHIILERIIKQINRIQAPKSDKPLSFEEEQTFLSQSSLMEYKDKISNLMEKRNKQSKRVYVIMSVLFIAIFILLMVFICKKWC